MHFAQLHQQVEPLLLANIWDAASARSAEAAGYAAIGTSSAAIASMLGYADGDGVSFAELKNLVVRLRAVTGLPLTVDVEAGYGETARVMVDNLLKLADIEVAGVKRISMGNVLHSQLQHILRQLFVAVRGNNSFQVVFDHAGH